MLCECFRPAGHPGPCEDDSEPELVIRPTLELNGGETIYRRRYPLPRWETLTESEVDEALEQFGG